MNNPKISIVVPVYNVEKYLEKCLESIINQTYHNIEIILVDDGSTDKSGELCDSYRVKDQRINVIHKKNGGLASARNVGMHTLTGDYIMFIDSDDWVDATICEDLLYAIRYYHVNASMCSYIREYPQKAIVKKIFDENVVLSGNLIERKLCGPLGEELKFPENMESLNSMWGKLYPAQAIIKENVTDNKIIGPSEDLLLIYRCSMILKRWFL